MIDLLNLSESDLQLVLDNAYAFPSSIQMQIKLNLHKMIGDRKFYFSRDNSLARYLINNVPSCELVKNIDAVTLQKDYSELYYMISSYVTDSVYRANLLNALSEKCYNISTLGKSIMDVENACLGFGDRSKLFNTKDGSKRNITKTNALNLALNVIGLKIKNFEITSSMLTKDIHSEYFSIVWKILMKLTDSLVNSASTPEIFKQIGAARVLLCRPLTDICCYNATWDRLYHTSYITYLSFENEEFAKIANKQTIELWDVDIVDLLEIISTSDIDEIFDTTKILQTDYDSLNSNVLTVYQMKDSTLVWAKNITSEDKTEAEKLKYYTIGKIETRFPAFKDNCSFILSDESLAFLKKEFPDMKFIKLIWDGVGEKNIRTVIKYEDSYYLLFEDSDNNIFALSQLDSTRSAKLINFSKNDTNTYKVVSNFEDFEKGE